MYFAGTLLPELPVAKAMESTAVTMVVMYVAASCAVFFKAMRNQITFSIIFQHRTDTSPQRHNTVTNTSHPWHHTPRIHVFLVSVMPIVTVPWYDVWHRFCDRQEECRYTVGVWYTTTPYGHRHNRYSLLCSQFR